MNTLKQKKILILASTFPRWKDDHVPGFVYDFAIKTSPAFKSVLVLAPHYQKALKKENISKSITVKRFQYFWPDSQQNIVYEGHAVSKVKISIPYILKLVGYQLALFYQTTKESNRDSLINAHWIIPQGFIAVIARRFTKAKVVVTVHGGDVFTLNGKFMTAIKRYTIKNADMVIVNSSATRRVCQTIYPNKDYPIIPMGVDINDYRLVNKKYYTGDRPLKVVFVGRLSQEKGVIYLCKAINKMSEARINLSIIGSGPESERLSTYIKENKLTNVKMHGWLDRNNIVPILKDSDVFVGPSVERLNGWKEAFGLVFVEAAAAGLPVITTDTGGIKDIVVDGQTGIFVRQRDENDIRRKLNYFIDNPDIIKEMSINARKRAKMFSWERSIEDYRRQFEKVMGFE